MLRAEAIPDFIAAGSPFWKPQRKTTKKSNPIFNKPEIPTVLALSQIHMRMTPSEKSYVVDSPRGICQL